MEHRQMNSLLSLFPCQPLVFSQREQVPGFASCSQKMVFEEETAGKTTNQPTNQPQTKL